MNNVEEYEFDRQGYLILRSLLTATEVVALAAAIDALADHALHWNLAVPDGNTLATGSAFPCGTMHSRR